MSQWVEYDPFTGVRETNIADPDTGVITVRKEIDVEPLLDRNKELANLGDTNIGIKKGLWHYCSIPLPVQYELLTKYQINVSNKNHWPRMFDIINRDYPYLKTTHKKHAMRGGRQIFAAPKNSPSKVSLTKPGKSPITT
jgi:hypothetical protein